MPKDERFPAFLFYPADFASDGKVEAMTTEEVGAYILLLCKAWHETPPCSIPDDDRLLARWTRLTPERWAECKGRVLSAFTPCAGSRLYQRRLRREYDKLRQGQNERSRKAKRAAELRWGRDAHALPEHAPSIADAVPTQCLSISSSSSSSSSKPPPGVYIREGGQAPPVGADHPVVVALDRWASAARGYPLNPARNEYAAVSAFLLSLGSEPPIVHGGASTARELLVPQAVDVLRERGAAFKSVKYAIACIKSELDEWGRTGVVGQQPTQKYRIGGLVTVPNPFAKEGTA